MAVNNKIDTKVFVPTQKSLTKVINANIEAMSKITDIALKSILSLDVKKKHVYNVDSHLSIFEKLFVGNKNVLTTIINASNNIASISRIKKIDVVIFKHNVKAIMNCYSYLLQAVKDFNVTNLTNTVFESFIYAITSMNTVIFRTNTLLKFNIGGLIGIKIKLLKLKFEIKIILKSFNNMIKSFSKLPVDYAAIELFRARLLPLIDVMNSVIELILKLAYLKIPIFIKHKLRRIKNILWGIVFTFSRLALTVLFSPFISLSILTISRLSLVVSMTSMIFKTLDETPVGPKMWIKIFMLNKSLDDLKNVFTSFNEIVNVLNNNKFNGELKEFGKVFVIITGITIIMHMIADMPTRARIKRRIKGVLFGIDGLQEIFAKLHSIKINQGKSNALEKAAYSLLVITTLSLIFSQILLMTPILILAIPAMLLFIGGVYLLRWVISITSKILTSSLPKMLLIMLVIGVTVSMFTTISIMFFLLAMIAKPIVLATGWILLMLGSITLVAFGIVLIGTLAATAIPFLLAGIAGFAILSMAVIALTAVAATLRVLQFINLDRGLIETNVDIVIGTANTVLYSLFENEQDDNRARYEKRWERRDHRKTFGIGIHGLFAKHIRAVLDGLTTVGVLMTTVLAVATILLTSILLKSLQFINIDNGRILTNVGIVLGVARSIMTSIFDDEKNETDTITNELEKPKKKNIFNMVGDAIINHIDVASDVTKIIKSVGSVAYLLATLASVGIIVVISSLLRIIQELNLNTGRIESNVDLVLKTVVKITDSLFNSTEPDNTPTKKPWLNRVIHNIGKPITDIFDAVMSIGFLAVSIGSVSLITILARQLATLNDIKITPDVTHSVDNIINSAQYVIFAINNRPDISEGRENPKKKGLLKKLLSGFGNGIEFIYSLGWLSTAMISIGMISKLAEHIKLINDLPNIEGIDYKTVIICDAADKIISSVTATSNANISETSRISVLERLNSVLTGISNITEDKVINTSKQVDNYIRFIDKVNTVDVNKLETSAKMFEQMASFSNSIKGDFKELAESLGEKLLPVLEELKEVMSEIPDKLDDGFQNTSASIAATAAPVTRENVTAQVNRENKNLTTDEVDKIVTSRLNEKAKADANSVASKIDELISLLKGYGGEHAVIQTM